MGFEERRMPARFLSAPFWGTVFAVKGSYAAPEPRALDRCGGRKRRDLQAWAEDPGRYITAWVARIPVGRLNTLSEHNHFASETFRSVQ